MIGVRRIKLFMNLTKANSFFFSAEQLADSTVPAPLIPKPNLNKWDGEDEEEDVKVRHQEFQSGARIGGKF